MDGEAPQDGLAIDFDPDALRETYRQEREKRVRPGRPARAGAAHLMATPLEE